MCLLKELTEGLTIPQVEKMERLAENITFDFNSSDSYIQQLTDLKESLFSESVSLYESNDDIYSFKGKTAKKVDNSLIGSASHLF